ncbi:MAG: hypothetical protein ABIT38_10205 [Gemmatimonadaceae bacterium]
MTEAKGTVDDDCADKLRHREGVCNVVGSGADAMVTESVVEQVVQALARGEALVAVARAYGLDPKTRLVTASCRQHVLDPAGIVLHADNE